MSFAVKIKKIRKHLFLSFTLLLIFLIGLNVLSKKNSKDNSSGVILDSQSEMTDLNEDSPVQEEDVLSAEVLGEDKGIEKSQIRFGVVVNDYSNKTGEISGLENILGTTVSTVGIYKQFGLPTNQYLIEDDLAYIKKTGKTLLLTWEPWNPNEGTSQSIDYLKEITEGKHDAYLTAFAQQVKNFANPVFLRFAHEMNGNWYPWGNRPSEYISAYRYLVDIFRREGITNVKFVWSINHESVPYEPINQTTKYFPGEAYVDMVGLDGYNFGTSRAGSTWRNFYEIFSPAYSFVSGVYPNKPIIIAEVASTEIGGNKTNWINDMFISLSKMPKIREIIWFSLLKETDWRIDSSPSSSEAFKSNLSTL